MKLTIVKLADFTEQQQIDLQKIWKNQNPIQWKLEQQQNILFYAARFNDRLLGAAKVNRENEKGYITDFCIREVTRRRGVGSYLLQQICSSNPEVTRWSFSIENTPEDQRNIMSDFLTASNFTPTEKALCYIRNSAENRDKIQLNAIHHVAIIASDYEKSKSFYCDILGLTLLSEHYRQHNDSWKADLAINGNYQIELFSFPNPPSRPSYPEASGLRHLAFSVDNLDDSIYYLAQQNIICETPRIDPYTQKRFTFFADPDGLPIELYSKK
ncbi:glyoxylase family protein [Moellerella wisconsensis ATCC 35017]|uniref:PanD regulatory factor n=1 Tax=Moellerella wisconsensis ATCC 35017 TaxID=1354267 RepID=A0A0N0IBQ6_9GAMM|nr:glyoxylase family protein [Moellerella wisconsensis ATCC 35017]VFS52468.1 putative lyase [Moellerella wisconsensis]